MHMDRLKCCVNNVKKLYLNIKIKDKGKNIVRVGTKEVIKKNKFNYYKVSYNLNSKLNNNNVIRYMNDLELKVFCNIKSILF